MLSGEQTAAGLALFSACLSGYNNEPWKNFRSETSVRHTFAQLKLKDASSWGQALCKEVRGVAVPLVDAFGIPDHILRAPIGLKASNRGHYHDYLAAAGLFILF